MAVLMSQTPTHDHSSCDHQAFMIANKYLKYLTQHHATRCKLMGGPIRKVHAAGGKDRKLLPYIFLARTSPQFDMTGRKYHQSLLEWLVPSC